jgi:hypothetical protein
VTRRNSARAAGVAFIAYIAIGVAQMVIGRGTTSGSTIAARLANLAVHATQLRVNALLGLTTCFLAFALGVLLYTLTRDADEELATFGLVCRVAEGLVGALPLFATRALLRLASAEGADPGTGAHDSLAALLFASKAWFPTIGALFFAAGSTAFSLVMLRGRLVPVPLALLGVVASALLVPMLALEFVGVVEGSVTGWMWAPMALFELWFAAWLIARGIPPARRAISDPAAADATPTPDP